MLTAKGLSWLAYRQEMQATMSDDQLALLDANMEKTLAQSCADMGVALEDVFLVRCLNVELTHRLLLLEPRANWKRKQDAPNCFVPTQEVAAEFSLGLAALEDWCCSRAHCSTLVSEDTGTSVDTEEDQELDMF